MVVLTLSHWLAFLVDIVGDDDGINVDKLSFYILLDHFIFPFHQVEVMLLSFDPYIITLYFFLITWGENKISISSLHEAINYGSDISHWPFSTSLSELGKINRWKKCQNISCHFCHILSRLETISYGNDWKVLTMRW